MVGMLLDLDKAVRLSGLNFTELPNWRTRRSGGGEDYLGVGIHHTGSYDDVGDTSSDLAYAQWMAWTGRSDLDPPITNLGLSAESHVFICAAGNANGMGYAKASGPMPARDDGNSMYIVIEAYNSGSQGWGTKGRLRDGTEITQWEGYVRLCAALCLVFGWPASHVRAHKETSITGKWDPGMMDMDDFRADVARMMVVLSNGEDDDMPKYSEWAREDKEALVGDVVKGLLDSNLAGSVISGVLKANVQVPDHKGEPKTVTVRQAIARAGSAAYAARTGDKDLSAQIDEIAGKIDGLNS